jgi:23S rRNA pseudouridine2604 synthase
LGETTKKCKVSKESVYVFRITLIQGLNRQIRRMCEYFGYEVIKLERVRIMNISLKGIPLGEWRQLQANEMEEIMEVIATSSSDIEPKAKSQEPRAKTTKSATSNYRSDARSPKPKVVDRSANPNPKSKELRGGGSSVVKKKSSNNSTSSFGGRKSKR